MQVVTTPEASAFIAANGGVAYVRPRQRKCCGGALTVLSATTTAPADASSYEAVGDPELGVRYRRPAAVAAYAAASAPAARLAGGALEPQPAAAVSQGEPAVLLIELRGRHRPLLAACWDGCVFKI